MLYIKKRYYAVNVADGGGGSSSSGNISVETEKYKAIVDTIERKNAATITSTEGYVEPDEECLLNDMIPDYQQADHDVEDLLRLMKSETKTVISLMRKMQDNYEEVDDEMDKDLQESAPSGSGASDSATTGSRSNDDTSNSSSSNSNSNSNSDTGPSDSAATGSEIE